MKIYNYKYTLSVFVIFFSCYSSNKILDSQQADYKNRPDWVKKRPVANNYYIGIGVASKQRFSTDYMKRAKNEAIADISSEISVKLKTKSSLNTLDFGNEFFEQYNSNINISTQSDLEDYEIVDAYENDYKYWVFYRINKDLYHQKQKQKKEKAVQISKNFFIDAIDYQSDNNYKQALIYYLKAMDAIKLFLADDLIEIDFKQKKIVYNNELIKRFTTLISNIRITPKNKEIKVKNATNISEDKLIFNINPPINKLYFAFHYSGAILKKNFDVSNRKGVVSIYIDNVVNTSKKLELSVEMDLDNIIDEANVDYVFKKIFRNLPLPNAKIDIIVQNPKLYIDMGDNQIFASIKNILSQEKKIDITDDFKQTDFILKLSLEENYSNTTLIFAIKDLRKNSNKQTSIETKMSNYKDIIMREYELRVNDWIIQNVLGI